MGSRNEGGDKSPIGKRRSLTRRILLLLILALVMWGYEYSRAIAAKISPEVHYATLLWFEERLFGTPLIVFFQAHRTAVLDYLFSGVYSLHPAYIVLLLLYLLARNEELYIHAIISVGFAGIIAVACYVLCPVAPPWIAVPGVTRIQNPILVYLGRGHSIDPNPYAAMPSMHVASAVLVGYYLVRAFPNSIVAKITTCSIIILMPIAVIYTGNHYLLDVIVGLIVAYISLRIADLAVDKLVQRD